MSFIKGAKSMFAFRGDLKLPSMNEWKSDYIVAIKNGVASNLPFEIKSIGFEKNEPEYIGAIGDPERLIEDLNRVIVRYECERNIPYLDSTSHLSCALRFGTASVKDVLRKALTCVDSSPFINELLWREFFNYLLYHFPCSETENLRDVSMKWELSECVYDKWGHGETAIPIVDIKQRAREFLIRFSGRNAN